MIRVLIAEDSATVRGLLSDLLSQDPDITIVGEAGTGREAVEMTAELKPDVVTMDVQMPVLDGLDATKEIMARTPTPIVIVSSAADSPEVGLSLSATRAGALMVLPTPSLHDTPAQHAEFVSLIKAMADVKVVRHRHAATPPRAVPAPNARHAAEIQIVAIAASTGGPAALQRVLMDLPRQMPPVVVVQHIANGFVEGLCGWLNASCNLRVRIAASREPLRPRTVYLAPDGFHLGVTHGKVQLSDADPIGGFRPSATFLFETVAQSYGPTAVALILTGMGSDGVAGLRTMRQRGGHVLAQDEASSVVYGMPREAVRAGVVDVQLPLESMGSYLTEMIRGSSHAR